MYYLGGAFPIALLSAIAFFDRPTSLDPDWVPRLLRRSALLAVVGVAHPVASLMALAITRDVQRDATGLTGALARRQRLTRVSAVASLAASMVIALLPYSMAAR